MDSHIEHEPLKTANVEEDSFQNTRWTRPVNEVILSLSCVLLHDGVATFHLT